ncbi:MAG: penicillin-binding protein 1C [Saprospiraceae bacterium]
MPRPLFDVPYSATLEDKDGQLLGAKIAADEQWRFQDDDEVPTKFAQALTTFEDKRFWYHPGVDLIGIVRAMIQNIKAGKIVSGGSTLNMQIISLAKGRKARGILAKVWESILALRLECAYSKSKILALYSAHAPFGGNVVGLEAASWRYFGKTKKNLTWAESALLAVLPNSPAMIHPGKNKKALLLKRNRLLTKMGKLGILSAEEAILAQAESIPVAPQPLPRLAPHLLETIWKDPSLHDRGTYRFRSNIDGKLQDLARQVIGNRMTLLKENQIHNAAAIILDIEQNKVIAYIGNVAGTGASHQESVDIVQARRSTGSLLKPFLYAQMLQESMILPQSIVPDIPTYINGFRPQNFFKSYDGAVPARRALIRSLNVPFTLLLQEYGYDKFHYRLRQLGMQTLNKDPNHYGLSLILGGAETTLWDMAKCYSYFGKVLNHYGRESGRYFQSDLLAAELLQKEQKRTVALKNPPIVGAGAIWATIDAMYQLERPLSEGNWEMFSSARPLAWKTGTSFGFRDAWAVGMSPKYLVAVWVGNADGEGRPGIVGYEAAGPILFDLFDLLPADGRFQPPYDDLVHIAICPQSGDRASVNCPVDSAWVPKSSLQGPVCALHKIIHLHPTLDFQVTEACMDPLAMRNVAWFVLSPLEEHYFALKNPGFKPLPAYLPGCSAENQNLQQIQWIYPKPGTIIKVPIDLNGLAGRVIFKATHRNPKAGIHWYLDSEYYGMTRSFHEMALNPLPGRHLLTLVDQEGARISQWVEILGK